MDPMSGRLGFTFNSKKQWNHVTVGLPQKAGGLTVVLTIPDVRFSTSEFQVCLAALQASSSVASVALPQGPSETCVFEESSE